MIGSASHFQRKAGSQKESREEFHLAAFVQNLKTMALRLLGPPKDRVCASIA